MMSELDRELLGVHVVYLPHYPYLIHIGILNPHIYFEFSALTFLTSILLNWELLNELM